MNETGAAIFLWALPSARAVTFLLIILGATSENAPKSFAEIAIGLTVTLIHLISIPVTAARVLVNF